MLRRLWQWFFWTLLLSVLVGLVAAPYAWRQLDDEVRWHVEEVFRRHYAGMVVRVRTARLIEGRGIEVRDLSSAEPLADGQQRELFHADEVFFSCGTGLADLAGGQPKLTGFALRRARVRATRRADGTWDVAVLWPPPQVGSQSISGTIEEGTLEVFDEHAGDEPCAVLRDINLRISRRPSDNGPADAQPVTRIDGSLGGDRLASAALRAWMDPNTGRWSAAGRVEGFQLAPELVESLPQSLAGGASALASLRAAVDCEFDVRHDRVLQPQTQFHLVGQITRGHVDDPRLPYPLMDLKADFSAAHDGFEVRNLTAHNGSTVLKLNCQQRGLEPGSPLVLHAEARQLVLDEQLRSFLPPALRLSWDKFLPRGEIDATVDLKWIDGQWRPEIVIQCRNAGFTYWKFPYPLEQTTGTVRLFDDVLTLDLSAGSVGNGLAIVGEIHRPGKDFWGWVELEAQGVPLDERLLASLATRHQDILRSLHATGRLNVAARFDRADTAEAPVRRQATIQADGCALAYERFAYPVRDIHGTLRLTGDRWEFESLQGSNDTARIAGTGGYDPAPGGDREAAELVLRLTAVEAPLDRELRDALPEAVQRAWDHLQPDGDVDIDATVRFWPRRPRDRRLSIASRVDPHGESVSIEPVCFPYRLEAVRGRLEYRDGHAALRGLRARHGESRFAGHGECSLSPDGSWRLELRDLAADGLDADQELLAAMPERLRRAVAPLELSGALYLYGTLGFARVAGPDSPIESWWDLDCGTHGGSLWTGVELHSVQGGARLTGRCDGTTAVCRGELAVDSVMWDDIQLTDVTGPIWIEDDRVLIGGWVAPAQASQPRRRIVANVCGGRVEGDARVALADRPAYELRADVVQADLGRAAREIVPGEQDLHGQLYATAVLTGEGRGIHQLRGRGTVRLRDADIYELPVMLALLKVLSAQVPDTTAFSQSDVDFRLEGGHVYFDRIDFKGDAISLLGTGEMNLDHEIRLQFHSMVGRGDVQIPLLQELLGEASQQTMTIHVGGTLETPETRFEPFPALNHALQQLQGDWQGAAPRSGARPIRRERRERIAR
jgi:hypothetical protein